MSFSLSFISHWGLSFKPNRRRRLCITKVPSLCLLPAVLCPQRWKPRMTVMATLTWIPCKKQPIIPWSDPRPLLTGRAVERCCSGEWVHEGSGKDMDRNDDVGDKGRFFHWGDSVGLHVVAWMGSHSRDQLGTWHPLTE